MFTSIHGPDQQSQEKIDKRSLGQVSLREVRRRNGAAFHSEIKPDEGSFASPPAKPLEPLSLSHSRFAVAARSPQNHHQLYKQLQAQQNRNAFHTTTSGNSLQKEDTRFLTRGGNHPQSDRFVGGKGGEEGEEILLSYQRFKNTAGVGLATQSVRRSLNEMTQQMKKSKEIHELQVERKNIENMIVNSKLWSPGTHYLGGLNQPSGNLIQTQASDYTSNVFRDKREELTKILKKRLNYIHQQSAQNQHMLSPTSSGLKASLVSSPTRGSALMSQSIRGSAMVLQGSSARKTFNKPRNLMLSPTASGATQEEVEAQETKLPVIGQHKSRHAQFQAGKGGSPFLVRTKEPQRGKPQKEDIYTSRIQAQTSNVEVVAGHVDAVIGDESYKRGMQEQLVSSSVNTLTQPTIDAHTALTETTTQQHGGNTSLQRQMIYQTDFQLKVGQINKRMDAEFESLDSAMEHLALKKPHQLGLPMAASVQTPGNKVARKATKEESSMEAVNHNESLNYINLISSNLDSPGTKARKRTAGYLLADGMDQEINIEDDEEDENAELAGMSPEERLHLEQIRSFAIELMRQRHLMQSRRTTGGGLARAESFNTDVGMVYSNRNDGEEDGVRRNFADEIEEEDEEEAMGATASSFRIAVQQAEVLETERGIKVQEKEFLKKVQGELIKEYSMNQRQGASAGQSAEESMYWMRKRRGTRKSAAEEIPPHVEAFMKNMKSQTLEALTLDVKQRNNFFQFVRHHQNAVFGEKFLSDPKLNYFLQCNKELVTALPIVSKIQAKSLHLFGYRLNAGVCKAIRTYCEKFKNALTKIQLDNNGMNTGDVLVELLEGLRAQEDFKQIVIIRNAIDDRSTAIIADMLQRAFPRCLDELRIVNCKISHANTFKLLSVVADGSSTLKKLSLAGAQISEQSLALLANIVAHVRSLQDLDISWNGLRPNANMRKFMDALGHNRSLHYLNLSWNNLMQQSAVKESPEVEQPKPEGEHHTPKPPKKEEAKDYVQNLTENLLKFIKYNRHLIHLDLSHARLDEATVLAIGTALRRAKSLVAVHMTGNPGVTEAAAEFLHQRIHCRPLQERQARRESQTMLASLNMMSPRRNKAYEGVQLKQILIKQKIISNTTGGQSFQLGLEGEKELQFQRWLGHKVDIPGSGQWQMNSHFQPAKEQCWVCHKWCYTIVYWSRSLQIQLTRTFKSGGDDWEEAELIQPLLRGLEAFPVGGERPLIAGSFTNWEVREMTPLVPFCEAMDANPPDPIELLNKTGRLKEKIASEDDLKTDKERMHLHRVKEQIVQDYKSKWKTHIAKSIKYRRACHINMEFAQELDLRTDDLFVYAAFGYPGQHLYYVRGADGVEHVNKCIIPLREDEIPVYEKVNKFKVQTRVFKKEHSVFKDWKEDTPQTLSTMFLDDIKWYKIARFIKDDTDRENVEKVLQKGFLKIKKIFTVLISQSQFPNIGWMDFSSFCDKCKIIDGKGVLSTTVDRAFIAANVAVEGQKISDDNPANALSRFEFLEILVRLAQAKFKETGLCSTFEESMTRLLDEFIFPLANPEPWQEFRDELLWTLDVNDVLEANLEGLKKVYTHYHEPRKKFMTMGDAMGLMMRDTNLGLIDKDAVYCFGMSKMSVILEQDNMWQYKRMQFVEFLELMGRIAHKKYPDHPDSHENLSLAQKIEHVLDSVLKLVDVTRKDVHTNVVEESESDDEY